MEPSASEGQVAAAPEDGQVAAAPQADEGQSVTSNQTTGNGSDAGESFFDPKSIEGKPELQSAYKQMQGEFTKRLQGIQTHQGKIDAYNAFERDPRGTMEQLARQYGYNMVQANPEQSQDAPAPSTWDEVYAEAEKRAITKLRQEFAPLSDEVQDLKRKSVESYLDKEHTDWRTYEATMVDTLKAHPSMANDPDLLYRMSVPPELTESRAMKAALAKIKGESTSSAVSGNKTTSIPTSDKPTGPLTLEDAVKYAKGKLAAAGMAGPLAD